MRIQWHQLPRLYFSIKLGESPDRTLAEKNGFFAVVGLCKEGRKTFKGGFGCIFKSAYRDTQHIEIVEGGKKIWEKRSRSVRSWIFRHLPDRVLPLCHQRIAGCCLRQIPSHHPKKRVAFTECIHPQAVWCIWGALANAGFTIPIFVNRAFLAMSFCLWLMGIIYNVRPIRTKDIPVIDVLSESVNTAIRLLMGWFIVSAVTLPPSTLMLG
ncbi:MAG: hypothetical protein IIU04_07600 [Bacteroidales bacterium]|nr:hypothetical protein [Bacteroidales bacterium]